MSRYRISLQVDMIIADDEAVQRVAHEEMTELATREGIASNALVDSPQQAADYVSQEMTIAVQFALRRIFTVGMPSVPGTSYTRLNIQRPELVEDEAG